MPSDGPINIDLQAVINRRLGKRAWLVPKPLVRALSRMICQEQLNEMLRVNYPRRGPAFSQGVLDHLNIKINVEHSERLPRPDDSRVIIVSNHPLGGLDGMAMISYFSRHYGRDVKFVVNDLLMAIEPLTDVFLPINKHGAQSRQAICDIDNAMAGDAPIIMYPAGLCSRLMPDKSICDLEWQKMFIAKAIEYKRDIVPVFFDGRNSDTFYKMAAWRKHLGIKFNIEMLRLPKEVFRAHDSTFTIFCGERIPYTTLNKASKAEAARIKDIVYSLRHSNS